MSSQRMNSQGFPTEKCLIALGYPSLGESELPSIADAEELLSHFLLDHPDSTNTISNHYLFPMNHNQEIETRWRYITLKWLTYGSTTSKMDESTNENTSIVSKHRIEQTIHFFVQSLKSFRERVYNSKRMVPPTHANSPERILIDTLWFVATQLYRETGPSTTMDMTLDGDTTTSSSTIPSPMQAHSFQSYHSFCSIVHGIIMGLDTTTNVSSSSSSSTSTFLDTSSSNSHTIIPWSLLLAGMEPIHLASVGILTDSTSLVSRSNRISRDFFTKQFSKYITNIHFKQTHSSLMIQDESEGYAKLLHLLMGLPFALLHPLPDWTNTNHEDYHLIVNSSSSTIMKKILHETILEMIGTFQLAPIRVLDLTLDILESHILSLHVEESESTSWAEQLDDSPNRVIAIHLLMDIIRMYPCINVAHLLRFKLWSYTSSSAASSDTTRVTSSTSTTLQGSLDIQKTGGNKLTTVTSNSSLEKIDGFKGKDTMNMDTTPNTVPQSLYITCALLESHGIQVLYYLVPRLSMDPCALHNSYDKKRKDDITRIRKIGIISLNSSSVESSTKVEVPEISTKEEPLKKIISTHHPGVDDDNDSGISWALGRNHQFLEILQACLQANLPWDDICSLLELCTNEDDIPRKTIDATLEACCGIYSPMGTSLCGYIDGMLSDLYAERIASTTEMVQIHRTLLNDNDESKHDNGSNQNQLPLSSLSKRNTLGRQSTLLDMARALYRPLRCIINTGSIAHCPRLYSKILRLTHSFLTHDTSTETAFDQETNYLFESFVVPSICLFPFNTALSTELWSVLSAISSFPIRYTLYGSIRSSGLEKEALTNKHGSVTKPLLQIESEVESGREVRYRLRRVSMENVREMGKQIAKVANTNPLVVFTAILNQIESYDNLISLMVDTFDFLTSYSLDVLGYCLLTFLGGGDAKLSRTKTKDDGISTAQWLSSLATFIGAFYRKFPHVEVRGLLSHMVKKISEGSVVELCVLQSLLKTAGGYGFADCSSIASLSQLQLEGRCGSLELRRETSDFGVIEKFDLGSSSKLRSALQSTNNFGTIFLILLSQIRYKLFNVKMSKIKLIGNALDMCQRTIFLLLTFITESFEEELNYDDSLVAKYAMSLPSPRDLFLLYGLEPVEIWTLHRPIFRVALSATCATSLLCSSNLAMIESMVSDYYNDVMTPTLYHVFFVLSIYDITYPEERYTLELNRLNREIDRLTKLQKGGKEAQATISAMNQAAAAAGVTGRDLRDASLFTKTHEQDLMRLKKSVDKLTVDMIRQKVHYEKIHGFLLQDKRNLFADTDQGAHACKAMRSYISECISPRCRLSPDNAIFCSKFSSLLHDIETPNFYLLFFYESLIESLERIIYGLTEDEASNFAIFFQDSWTSINEYRFDAKLYESSLQGKIGSLWPADIEPKQISHNDFVEIYKRWHDSVTLVLLGALNAVEYMFCRAALIVLSRLVHVFPTNARTGRKLIKALLRFQATDFAMQDLKAMAQGYKSQLLQARDKGLWKEEKPATGQDGKHTFIQKHQDTDFDTMEVVTEPKDMSGSGNHSLNGLTEPQDTDGLITASKPNNPDEVNVANVSKSSENTAQSSIININVDITVEPKDGTKPKSHCLSQNGEADYSNSGELDHSKVDTNETNRQGNQDAASLDPAGNGNKVDGPNLGSRWEKADESKDRKRKATYYNANDAHRRSNDGQRRSDDGQRRSEGKSYGRPQYQRRSY